MKGQALKVVYERVAGPFCQGCVQEHVGIKRLEPDGTGANGVLLQGDSPWVGEIAAGTPFAGPSGQWLNAIFAKRGLSREDFLISNTMNCKPPHLDWTDHPERHPEAQLAIRQCKGYTDRLIEERKPKVIVPLGNVAMQALTGFSGIEQNHSYVLPSIYGIPAVPTFHPSAILQGNHNLTIAVILGIARALEIANGTFKPTVVNIVEDPDPSYLQYGGRGADLPGPLMCDIETPKSLAGRNEEEAEDDPSFQIVRMGFAVSAWAGVSFPYDGDYIRRAKELIRKARVLLFWNKNYDLPRLRSNGFTFHPDVTVVDAMWAWHWLYSDLPKALAFAAPFFYSGAPWKHLASQRPAYYNAMDNGVQMGVYQGVKAQLEKDGRWDRFWSHCVKVDPIYVQMGEKGVKVDKGARETFMVALEKEALAELVKVQELVPPAYKERFTDKVIQESFKELKLPKVSAKVTKRMYQSLIRVERVEVPALHKDGSVVLTATGEPLLRPLWKRSIPFNPRSRPDMLRLMHVLGVKVPKARGEDRESVEAKYLKRLTKFPIFRHCVNYGQRTKLISTYNWPLNAEDRATSQYGYHPSTWRSSSRKVNLGNIPKRFELAKLYRGLLIAEAGCKLIEIDRSAIEAVLVGYWGKSPEYINLAKAGVHSMLVSHVIGRPVPDTLPFAELKKALKEIKKVATVEQYEGCKRCIHGCVTGDHEVLTKRGWVPFNLYQGAEPIAVWDNGDIRFEVPSRLIREQHTGTMIKAHGQSVSALMTTNHRLPVYLHHPSEHGRVKGIEASNLNRGFIPVGGNYTGGVIRYSLEAVRLAVAIQADGSMVGNQIRFDLSMPKKIERLKELLSGIPHRSYPSARGTIRTIINCNEIPDPLTICTSAHKIFSLEALMNFTPMEAAAFLDEIPLWDGSVGKTKLYYTTVKHNAEAVQALSCIHNRTCLFGEQVPKSSKHKLLYILSFPNRKWTTVRSISKSVIDFSGPVFCVKVSSGYFIVRHNNKVYVTGNSNYLLSPYGMHDEFPEYFPTEYAAQKMQDLYFSTPAGQAVRAWHKATIEEAYAKKYLDNSFQYRHYFFGPMYKFNKRDKKWAVDHEGDAKRAVAFRPQSDAAAIQRCDLLALEEEVPWMAPLIRLPTYDSLVIESPTNLVDKCIEALVRQFSKPIPELDNLTIGFEIKVGDSLGNMEEVPL